MVIVCTAVALLLHASFTVYVRVMISGQLPLGTSTEVTTKLASGVQASLIARPMPSSAATVVTAGAALTSQPSTVLAGIVPVIVGGTVSRTVIVWEKLGLKLPHPSPKFQVRTRTYAFSHATSGEVMSFTRFSTGVTVQLSVAVGVSNSAAARPAASLHSTVRSNAPANVPRVGGVVSRTVIV